MMRRGESFHGTAGGGRFWLELVRTCPCLSVPIRHPTFEAYTIKREKKKKRKRRESRDKVEREEVGRKYEREREGERRNWKN